MTTVIRSGHPRSFGWQRLGAETMFCSAAAVPEPIKSAEIWESPTGERRLFWRGDPVEIHCRGGRAIGGHCLVVPEAPVDLTAAGKLADIRFGAPKPKEPS
jgi:hypothetical protein